jgi:AcrR family transcriptional regulator
MVKFSSRQKEIIQASIDIITKKGIQELSTRNIAHLIGISEPAIYRHFENKKDILINIAIYLFDNWDELFKRMEIPEVKAIDQLEYVTFGIIKYFADNMPVTITLFSLKSFQNDKPLLNKILSIIEISIKSAGEIIKKGQDEGNIRKDIPSIDIAKIIIASIYMLADRLNLSGYKTDLFDEWKNLWHELKKIITP